MYLDESFSHNIWLSVGDHRGKNRNTGRHKLPKSSTVKVNFVNIYHAAWPDEVVHPVLSAAPPYSSCRADRTGQKLRFSPAGQLRTGQEDRICRSSCPVLSSAHNWSDYFARWYGSERVEQEEEERKQKIYMYICTWFWFLITFLKYPSNTIELCCFFYHWVLSFPWF